MMFTQNCAGDLGIEVRSKIEVEDGNPNTVVALLFKHSLQDGAFHIFDIVCGGAPKQFYNLSRALNEMLEIAYREETASQRNL